MALMSVYPFSRRGVGNFGENPESRTKPRFKVQVQREFLSQFFVWVYIEPAFPGVGEW